MDHSVELSARAAVEIQLSMDPNVRIYHGRTPLADVIQIGFRSPAKGDDSQAAPLGAFGELILNIDGVEVVRVTAYFVMVQKAVAFSWEEVEPCIVELFRGLKASQVDLASFYDKTATAIPQEGI